MLNQYVDQNYPLLTFFVLVMLGLIAGKVFHKLKLPHISGQVLVGVLLGPSILKIFNHHALESVQVISTFALGIMTFLAGTHLNFKRIHNSSKRIMRLVTVDVLMTFWLVFFGMYFFAPYLLKECNIYICLIVASISVATAPGTIISLIRAKNARGTLVKTLVAVVALNNVATIVLFEITKNIAIQAAAAGTTGGLSYLLGKSLFLIIVGIAIGAISGFVSAWLSKDYFDHGRLFSTGLLTIFFNLVICHELGLSPLLTCLATGVVFSNVSHQTKKLLGLFDNLNGIIFALFFTLAGTHLNLSLLKTAGYAGILFVGLRLIAKCTAPYIAARILNHNVKIRRYLGMALIPQAGLAIGLVISLGENEALSVITPIVTTLVLASVAINELIGPVTVSKSFDLSKETGQGAPRIVDFLHEEFIYLPLKTQDKWEALEELTKFLYKTNHVYGVSKEELLESVLGNEKQFTSGLGAKVAFPHCDLPTKKQPIGVIGISPSGIDFEAIDGEKVHIIVLMGIPKDNPDLYANMFATVLHIFADDAQFQEQVINAERVSEVYELLQTKEVRGRNLFLDDDV